MRYFFRTMMHCSLRMTKILRVRLQSTQHFFHFCGAFLVAETNTYTNNS
jgi:hypothetical protein